MSAKRSITYLVLLALVVLLVIAAMLRRRIFHEALVWPDRRPIASLVLATAAAGWPSNPRGWFIDPSINVTTPQGVAQFHERLLKWADTSIGIMRSMDAQGMLTWDIEGEQYPHRTTYVGDPRLAGTLDPEIAGVMDEYFRRFRTAGFRVGLTVRPQQLLITNDGKSARQVLPSDPASILIAKIRYAQARWGATIFYVDSNWGRTGVLPLSAAVMEAVARAVPAILLIPEHKTPGYFSVTAPYSDMRDMFWGTPGIIRWLYPHAFSVISVGDGNVLGRREQLAKQVSNGDVILFRGWFPDPANAQIREMIGEGKTGP